jgi:hypothetical protein
MTTTNDWKTRLATLALSTSLIASAASVDAATGADGGNPLDGNWHFTLTPYLWLPNFNGTADVRLPGAFDRLSGAVEELRLDAEVGPNDYLENLQFALMLTGEARKGRWSALTDFIYVDFGDQKTHARNLTGPRGRVVDTVDRELETSLSSTVWTLAGAYTVAYAPSWHVDVLAGFRYLGMDSELKWAIRGSRDFLDSAGRVSQDKSQWDGIVGVKGQVRLGDGHWFVPYYADIGTGDSNWTWQALVGVGYAFDWGDLSLSIRSLSYDFEKDNADLRMTGPALGVSFRW